MFRIGDKVKWSSSAGGSTTEKVGEVVFVVKAKTYPNWDWLNKVHNSRDTYGGGLYRRHESYVVLVRTPGNKKDILYWPRVSALTSA